MNLLDALKAKFAGNQAVLDEIATEEAQAAADAAKQAEQVAQVVDVTQAVAVDPNRPPARFASLCEAYDAEHGVAQ